MKKILILTHARDDCADLVTSHLDRLNAEYIRFNTEEFQTKVKFVVDLSSDGILNAAYMSPDWELNFDDIGVVWNRRVHDPDLGDELDYNPELKEWMQDETTWGLSNSFTLINAPIVNPWEDNERLKFNKWIQMRRAAELGFEIPASRMTNNRESIREFWETTKHEMIFKKIRKGLFKFEGEKTLIVHTSKIPEEKFDDQALDRMRFCPMFFQEHIPKKYDVRSIVVGCDVFSVTIDSQSVPEGVVDFRTAAVLGKLREMKHEVIDLGPDVNSKLVQFTRSFGLSFSAIDLIITPDNRIVFLEDNPNGQWGWLEHLTNVPISQAFAEYLIKLRKA